ncbi:hypothetical protein [Virgibacillus necropolis]|uniref:Uncharacterized protein n=1 Tax=Virgibacillus necropolis TaxID=163877 RepID=A0A221M7H3_9BACI|nr:hypothetical protein [Virgibacillus necropolis]ASN03587.1 hypothetical protein CFK40_00380 [Virgibacillus necropolis]
MEINKISLMEAYMLETLRSNGVSDQELINQIAKSDASPWQALSSQFDFNQLIKIAEQDPNAFKSIVLDGYKVKFVTFKGIQTLLKLKFNKLQGHDYQLTEKSITDLKISEKQLFQLRQILSKNWIIHETSPENSNLSKEIRIELT